MKAIQLVAFGQPGKFELRDVPDPRAGAGEVVVQVQSCGLNHLDLWLEEAGLPITVPLPRIPGGEIAGKIVEVGAQVTGWNSGDLVAIQSNLFCGECEFCVRGEDSMCLRGEILGVQRDGGFAENARFAESLELFSIAASVGSTESLVMPPQLLHGGEYTAEQRARSLVGKGTVRLSIGLEDEEDLKADLAQALDRAFT